MKKSNYATQTQVDSGALKPGHAIGQGGGEEHGRHIKTRKRGGMEEGDNGSTWGSHRLHWLLPGANYSFSKSTGCCCRLQLQTPEHALQGSRLVYLNSWRGPWSSGSLARAQLLLRIGTSQHSKDSVLHCVARCLEIAHSARSTLAPFYDRA